MWTNQTSRKQAVQEALQSLKSGVTLYRACKSALENHTANHDQNDLTTKQYVRFVHEINLTSQGIAKTVNPWTSSKSRKLALQQTVAAIQSGTEFYTACVESMNRNVKGQNAYATLSSRQRQAFYRSVRFALEA